jgi:parallel beta-helix repeat protein
MISPLNVNVNSNEALPNSRLKSSSGLANLYIYGNTGWEDLATTYEWCTGSGEQTDPYVIKDLLIDAGGNAYGILIENSNVYFRIERCTIYNTGFDGGICLRQTQNGQLIDNYCSNNRIGIKLHLSDNNVISGNQLYNNIASGLDLTHSNENTISKNFVNENYGWGMFIMECDRSTITGNTVNYNTQSGILIESNEGTTEYNIVSGNTVNNNGWNGIYLARCRYSTISGNSFVGNIHDGISLVLSQHNDISKNTIKNNGIGTGIDFQYSDYNRLYLNDFINNDVNLYINSFNYWNSPELISYTYNGKSHQNYLGNYWSDYFGNDVDEDGIGDTPYIIHETQVDYNPLVEAFENYLEPGEKPLPFRAAEIAKLVIGAKYTFGAKGFDFNIMAFLNPSDIKTKAYLFYYKSEVRYGPGLDCSGLVFWSYNREGGATKYQINGNPVYYEGANLQYDYDFQEPVSENNLKPGDLLFFDFLNNNDYETPQKDGRMDHVAMYVGPFHYLGGIIGGIGYPAGIYDCVHASLNGGGVIPDTVENLKTLKINNIIGFEAFRRWTGSEVDLQIIKRQGTDLKVTDPDGFIITKEIQEIPGMLYYAEYDMDGDGIIDDIISIPEQKLGEYLIEVIPEDYNVPTDVYTLEISTEDIIYTIAENIQIADIPEQPYIVRSTETEIIPIIPATVDFDPDTLNLQSSGKWVTVYIELPIGHGYDISEIDISSILLNDQINAKLKPNEIGDYDLDGIPDLMVKFDLFDVQEKLQVGEEVTVIITGKLEDERVFRGKDTIRVISHEEIVYSQRISFSSLISANPLTGQLVSLIGIAITLMIISKKRISSKF